MSWPISTLGEHCDILSGYAFKSSQFNTEGDGLPLIRIRDVVPGKSETYYSGEYERRFLVTEGDLLIGMDGDFNRARWHSGPALLNQRVCKVLAKGNLDQGYLYHLLPSVLQAISDRTPFVTVKHLSARDLKDFEIPLPPLGEQKRIAGILDQADALRRLRVRALEKLNTLGQAVFQEMFGTWDKISPYPTSSLGRILDFLTSGSRGWGKYYSDGGAKFIRIQNVKRDEFSFEDIAYVNPPRSSEAVRTRVYTNDVLLSITADLGRSSVVPDGVGEAYINQHLAILRTSKLNPVFLSSLISSPSGQRMISRGNKEGVKAGLNFDDIRSMQIIEPPTEVQIEFSDRKKAVEDLIEIARNLLKQADSLFASLQSAAFQGKL